MKLVDEVKGRLERVLIERPVLGFPFSVFKKFGDDRAGQLAALVAYYGFLSLFPLLLVAVTVLGILLRTNPELQGKVLDSALTSFPIIGDQLRENVRSISGGTLAIVVGIGGALWGGLGGIKAMQNAFDRVWGVPIRRQPNFVTALARSGMMLLVLGVFAVIGMGTSALGAATESVPLAGRLISLLLSAVVNIVLFLLAFKILTVADVSWGDVFPGAMIGGVTWTGLQAVGQWFLGTRLESASEVYGFFGLVLGLLGWIYLGAQITLLAAEVNVVRKLRLWPRSFGPDPKTEADCRALEFYARVEERAPSERIAVGFERPKGEARRSA